MAEREDISRGLVAGQSIRCIATSLGRPASTVSREVRRNEGPDGYRATQADQAAWDRARRPKTCKLIRHRILARHVAGKLQRRWSVPHVSDTHFDFVPDPDILTTRCDDNRYLHVRNGHVLGVGIRPDPAKTIADVQAVRAKIEAGVDPLEAFHDLSMVRHQAQTSEQDGESNT